MKQGLNGQITGRERQLCTSRQHRLPSLTDSPGREGLVFFDTSAARLSLESCEEQIASAPGNSRKDELHSLRESSGLPEVTVKSIRAFFCGVLSAEPAGLQLSMWFPMPALFSDRFPVHSLCILLAGFVCGCGSQTYQERLNASREYFEYRREVDSILELRWWQAGDFGLEFRVPKGFVEIPGPETEEDPDIRQPDFLPRPLPGLVGAWEAQVPVEIEDSDTTELRAWIFICTNHADHLKRYDDPLIEPEKFTDGCVGNIAFNLRYDVPTEEMPWPYDDVRTPSGKPYVPRKNYVAITLQTPLEIDGSGEIDMNLMLNQYSAGPVQLNLIAVYPVDIESSYRIERRIRLAMETLRLSEEVPRPPRAGAPQSSGGGF